MDKYINLNVYNYVLKWWWGGEPDVKNDISGMSLRDVCCVHTSWRAMYANATVNGVLVFKRLFQADPETQKFFKYIADASEADLAKSVMFRAHVVIIMSSLNNAVENLREPEIVVPLMEKLGDSHNARHIKRKHFLLFRDVMVNILERELKASADVVASWRLFLEFINKCIFTKILE